MPKKSKGKANKAKAAPVAASKLPAYLENGFRDGFSPKEGEKNEVSSEQKNVIKLFFEERDLSNDFISKIVAINSENAAYENIIIGVQENKVTIPKIAIDSKYSLGIEISPDTYINSLTKFLNIIYEYGDKKHLLEVPPGVDPEAGIAYLAKAAHLSQLYTVYKEIKNLSMAKTYTDENQKTARQLQEKAAKIMAIEL